MIHQRGSKVYVTRVFACNEANNKKQRPLSAPVYHKIKKCLHESNSEILSSKCSSNEDDINSEDGSMSSLPLADD